MSDCIFKGWMGGCVVADLRRLGGRGWLSNCRFKGWGDGDVIADLRVGWGGCVIADLRFGWVVV